MRLFRACDGCGRHVPLAQAFATARIVMVPAEAQRDLAIACSRKHTLRPPAQRLREYPLLVGSAPVGGSSAFADQSGFPVALKRSRSSARPMGTAAPGPSAAVPANASKPSRHGSKLYCWQQSASARAVARRIAARAERSDRAVELVAREPRRAYALRCTHETQQAPNLAQ
jgi:hypothetical protein